MGAQQPFVDQRLVRLVHRVAREAEAGGQLAAGGQALAGGQPPRAQQLAQVLLELAVDRLGAAAVGREGEVVSTSYDDDGVRIRARLSAASAGRLAPFVVVAAGREGASLRQE